MARPLQSPVLAGRAGELAELQSAFERAEHGHPGAVLIGGEAGIGKTRLLTELTARAERDDALVLAGQCVGLQAAIPLLPVADALARLADHAGETPPELEGLLAGGEPWTAAAEVAALPPERVFAATAELVRRLSDTAPVVLTIEDIHWADHSTLDLLMFLLRRLRDERVLVAATYRSDEVGLRDPLRAFLAEASRTPLVERIELRPLSAAETAVQLEGILGAPPPREQADAIAARAEGNPLFVEELAAQIPADALPTTLRDMLLARIERLGPAAQEVVRSAAAGGRRVHHRLLAGAVDMSDAELTAALRDAVRHHVLIADADSYAFRHALLQEAAYGELLPGERARLHAAFAQALEEHPELAGGNAATVAAELAHHWDRAGDEPRAFRAALRAGAEAGRLHAPAEATDHLTRALALWDAVEDARVLAGFDRAALAAHAAEAAAACGRQSQAVALVEEAIALVDPAADPVRTGRLHARRGWFMWYDGRGSVAVPAFEEAVRLVPAQPPSAARADVVAGLGLMLMLTGRTAESRVRCAEAIAVARAVGARAEEADALGALGMDLGVLGDREAGIDCLRRAREIARAAGAPNVYARAAINLSDLLRRQGLLQESLDVALDGAEACRRVGLDLVGGAVCQSNAADAAFDLGHWDLADRLSRELLDGGATGMNRVGPLRIRGALELARGDFDAAAAAVEEQRELVIGELPESLSLLFQLEAELALWRGDPAAAAAIAADAAGGVASDDPLLRDELLTLAVRAEADQAAIARARRDEPATAAAAARARALRASAGDIDAAETAALEAELARAQGPADAAAWAAAARAWDERSVPYRAAYARWREAEALLAGQGARAAAADALRAAHAIAQELGAPPLSAEIEALARRARIDIAVTVQAPEPAPDDGLGLTAREHEVLAHLALGQTNRQIADALFISVKTAGAHVSNILAKLGVSTRGEAAAVAHRLGLVR